MPKEGKLYYCDTCNAGYFEMHEAAGCEKMCGVFTLVTREVSKAHEEARQRAIRDLTELITAYQTSNNIAIGPIRIWPCPDSANIGIEYYQGLVRNDRDRIYWKLLFRMLNESTGQIIDHHAELTVYQTMLICSTFKNLFAVINSAGNRQPSGVPGTAGQPASNASTPLPGISP